MKKELLMLVLALGIVGCGAEKEKKAEIKPLGEITLTDAEKDLSVRNVEAKNGIVATAHPLASKVGLEILKNGGNAIDAAVGAAFTLGLVEPNASGPGGGGFTLVSKDGEEQMYSYYQKAPASMTEPVWRDIYKNKKHINTSVGSLVPGAVAGWLKMLEDHGTMTPDQILQPIIKLANDGYEVTPTLAGMFSDSYEKLMMSDATMELFLADGLPYSEGEIFKNPDYAKTLGLIAKDGKKGFYESETAKAITELNPMITMEDMAGYNARVVDPVETEYRGYRIVTAAPESCGVALLQILNTVEKYDLKGMGLNNPDLYHVWAEAMNLAHADRYQYVADPFYADTPAEVLATQEYADVRGSLIKMDSSLGKPKPGKLTKKEGTDAGYEYEPSSTTHISIIDKDGNAVSMTNTIGNFFGYGFVPEDTGFAMNSHVSLFSTSYPLNVVEPGKRPRSTMSPTFVFDKNDELVLVIGTPGGSRITDTIPYVISNVIDHGMSMQEAIDYPRIHKLNGKLNVEGRMDPAVVEGLKAKGQNIIMKGDMDNFFGGVHGILIKKDGTLEGGADPRRDGKALGY